MNQEYKKSNMLFYISYINYSKYSISISAEKVLLVPVVLSKHCTFTSTTLSQYILLGLRLR